MQVNITARHLDLTPALADYVQKKLDRVSRHFKAVVRAHVILELEKRRHIAEIVVHASGHHDFRAKGESVDLYAAVDLVAEKLHKHMARQKDKRVRGRRGSRRAVIEMPAVFPALPDALANGDETLAPPITQVRRLAPRSLTATEAIEEMERKNFQFLVFYNDDLVNVVYKRKDGTYGLLELDS
jgi:putative sigma-54 modulation protein